MVLWTIQTKQAYEKLMQDGVLRTEEEYITLPECKNAYLWLIEQMKQRVGNPPDGVTYPVWAWYQWGSKRKRLDMRSHGRGWCADDK